MTETKELVVIGLIWLGTLVVSFGMIAGYMQFVCWQDSPHIDRDYVVGSNFGEFPDLTGMVNVSNINFGTMINIKNLSF